MRERKSASEWLPHRTAAVVLRIGFRVQMVDAIRAWAKEAEKNILPQIGGTGVTNFDPAVKKDGTLLGEGYITIQGESHSTEFRKIELLNLSACMDPKASNYKSYYAIPYAAPPVGNLRWQPPAAPANCFRQHSSPVQPGAVAWKKPSSRYRRR